MCREVVDRIVMHDTSDERKSLGIRRCKSAMLARELPPSETAVKKTTTERLIFDEDANQIVIEEVLDDKASPFQMLRRCKSADEKIHVPGASKKEHASKLRRCMSSVEGPSADSDLDSDLDNDPDVDYPCKLRRSESADMLP